MMSSNAQVTVNAANFLRLLNQNLYVDKAAVVDELLQNAQRAGATHFEMELQYGKLEARDNGCGCSDPSRFLVLAESGWGDEAAGLSPFGLGFWSTTLFGGTVVVRSFDWEMTIDVELLRKGNVDSMITLTADKEHQNGTTVQVFSEDLGDMLYDLRDRLTACSRFSRFEKVTLFDRYYEQGKALATCQDFDAFDPDDFGDAEAFARVVRTGGVTGVLLPAGRFWSYPTAYLQNRPVCRWEPLPYVQGHFSVGDAGLTARAPDRKAFIEDEAYDDMLLTLGAEVSHMYAELATKANDEEMTRYEDGISKYVDAETLASVIDFHVINEEETEELISLLEIAAGLGITVDVDDERSLPALVLKMRQLIREREEKAREERGEDFDDVELRSESDVPSVVDHSAVKQWSTAAIVEPDEKAESPTGGRKKLDQIKMCAWCSIKDVSKYAALIQQATYNGIPLVLAANRVQERVLESRDDLFHIISLPHRIKRETDITHERGRGKKVDDRRQYLLDCIGKEFGVKIHLADIKTTLTLDDTPLKTTRPQEVTGIARPTEKLILLQRVLSGKYPGPVPDPTHETWTKHDLRWLLPNVVTLGHELSHVCSASMDGTQEHYSAEEAWTSLLLAYLAQKI